MSRIIPMVTEHDDGTVLSSYACSEHGDTVVEVVGQWTDRRTAQCRTCRAILELES